MTAPDQITIRSYQVGFGDCFLLSFGYAGKEKHVLIDYGSTGLPDDVPSSRMKDIATNIRSRVGTEPFAVVATHRHRDHISGFATNASHNGTGDIIGGLKPKFVIQPWTEDPNLATTATGPAVAPTSPRAAAMARVQSLAAMQTIASQVWAEVKHNRSLRGPLRTQLGFLGENNIANPSAVKNLMTMAPNEYVHFGSTTKLSQFLPGVSVDVLGPPTVDQSAAVKKQRARDKDEFWHLMAAAGGGEADANENAAKPLFADEYIVGRVDKKFPPDTRWLIRKALQQRGQQMLGIVRALDKAMNNTSVILLFRTGGKSLLFPGDAQIENWQFALSKPAVMARLKKVDVYKVGHHGSLNATPMTLWDHFERRSPNKSDPKRMISVMSTMLGKHGSEDDHTEVPRERLTAQLRKQTNHYTTQTLAKTELFRDIVIKIGRSAKKPS